MAVVVKWKSDGDYLRGFSLPEDGRGLHWTSHRRRALRFESQAQAKRIIRDHVGHYQYTSEEVAFVRLVPKRQAEQASADPVAHDIGKFIIENTTQKSMCAMKLAEHIMWRLRHVHGLAPRAAFGIAPTDPGKPPTVEPAPRNDDAFDGFPADAPPEINERAAEIAAIVDERVTRVLEQRRARITADLTSVIVAGISENLMPHEIAYRVLRRLEYAHSFVPSGPAVPGAPLADMQQPAAGTHTEIMDGGVSLTVPVEMSLGEVWTALSSAPAFRVCLDSETRRAREQGAADMRERAAIVVDEEAGRVARGLFVVAASIRALPLDGARHDSAVVSDAADDAGMRIDRRADGEWLVVADDVNTCEEVPPGMSPDDWSMVCTHHFDGQHISCGKRDACAYKIDARWPITGASQ